MLSCHDVQRVMGSLLIRYLLPAPLLEGRICTSDFADKSKRRQISAFNLQYPIRHQCDTFLRIFLKFYMIFFREWHFKHFILIATRKFQRLIDLEANCKSKKSLRDVMSSPLQNSHLWFIIFSILIESFRISLLSIIRWLQNSKSRINEKPLNDAKDLNEVDELDNFQGDTLLIQICEDMGCCIPGLYTRDSVIVNIPNGQTCPYDLTCIFRYKCEEWHFFFSGTNAGNGTCFLSVVSVRE